MTQVNRVRQALMATAAAALAGGTVGAAAPAFAGPTRPAPAAVLADLGCLDGGLEQRANSGVQGGARLCHGPDGVRAEVLVDNLQQGTAYTLWLVYFDRPAACQVRPCPVTDAAGDDPQGVVARADSAIGGPTGRAALSGTFHDLRLSKGAEVHLPIFGHGPANTDDLRALARQLLTPQLPILGAPMGGAAADGPLSGLVAVAVLNVP